MRRSLSNAFRTLVVIWVTLSITSVIVAFLSWQELSHRFAASTEAVRLRETVDRIVLLLLEIETAERGYTITGRQSYNEPIKRAETELPVQFDNLAEIARQDSALTKEVMELRARTENALALYRRVMALRESEGFTAAAQVIDRGEGSKAMELVRRKADQISTARYDMIAPEGVARVHLFRASATSLVAGLFGVGAAFLAFLLERHLRELANANQQAERNSQAKSELLASMSHEIRTPMNSVLGFSELLEMELHDPRQRRYIQSVRSSANSLLQLINDVLDLSKIEAGAMMLRPGPTDPREVCDFIQVVFAEAANRKGVKMRCHVAEDIPRSLLMDRLRLRQVMVNLVGNALKFTDQGSIDVRLVGEKQERSSRISLVIEVEDTGIGIPEERLEDIFRPFVQARSDQDKEKQGSGLGLSIVKRLTEVMGGTVTVQSQVGKGSLFRLCFNEVPISARLATTDQEEEGALVDFDEILPVRILVVDDNELNRQLLAAMFENSHHELCFGSNGREAVEVARKVRPDIALLDIRMPEMGGMDAVEAIRQTPGLELMPIIAVTASSMLERESEERSKFSGYLRKPVSRRQVFHELAQFLPRKPKSQAEVPSEADTPDAPGQWREITAHLREMEAHEWPGVRDRLAINEILTFASRLENLGAKENCGPLIQYARSLTHHAESYAVGPMEKLLMEFPTLVNQVDRLAGS
jgi:signal transduction histidine kinase/ActR/RegA family two-component response regulator